MFLESLSTVVKEPMSWLAILKLAPFSLIGVGFHVWQTCNSLKTKATAAGMPFTFKDYLREDGQTFIGTFLAVSLLCAIYNEIDKLIDGIPMPVFTFIIAGYAGSTLALFLLGRANKVITAFISQHTQVTIDAANVQNFKDAKDLVNDKP